MPRPLKLEEILRSHREIRRRRISRRELMPGHVALILDGNRRWAEVRGLGSDAGHDAGLKTLLQVMGLCAKWGINVATFFLFSSENWRRPKINRQGIRISTIGDTSLLPDSLQENDIVQACQNISKKVRDGLIEPNDVCETLIEQELETKITRTPCPDLLIRTSGELRISNFLLWQLAYSELYFTKTLWPEFGESEFVAALESYQTRGRRFGGRL
uniref:Alkyl transferase n=1 Tax=Chenopodium quinoa TaxID=63459 RepID=A0A803LCQ4_CHEQI